MLLDRRTLPPCTLPLTSDVIRALHATDRSWGRNVRIFQQQQSDHLAGCIVISEIHGLTSKRTKQRDATVVSHFPRRGVEGQGEEGAILTWGERIVRLIFPIYNRLLNVVQFGSITDVAADFPGATTFETAHNFRPVLAHIAAQHRLFDMTTDQQAEWRGTFKLGTDKQTLTGTQVVALLSTPPPPASISMAHLEHGHRPGLHEQISSLIVPIGLVTIIGAISFLCFNTGTLVIASTVLWMAPLIVGTLVGSAILANYFPHRPVLQYLLDPVTGGFLYGRDRTMAQTIDINLRFIRDDRIFLATMGIGHLNGVGYRLQHDHGFTEVRLPELPAAELV